MRTNRETIYNSAIVDISAGATVTIPDAGGRYLSVAVINEDNYTTEINHGAGTHELTIDEHETPFVLVVARILGDWTDKADLRAANELQDRLRVESASSLLYDQPAYDPETFDTIHHQQLTVHNVPVDGSGPSASTTGMATSNRMRTSPTASTA